MYVTSYNVSDPRSNFASGVVKVNIFSNIGFPGLVLIVIIALVVFGPSKLPEIGKALGSSLREFKNATKDIMVDDSEASKQQRKQ